MKNKEIRVLEMLIRVRRFGSVHAAAFPANSRGAELFSLVSSIITEMETHATAQDSGKRAAKERTALKRAALERLREKLEAISRTARAMALSTPGLDDKFHMPQSMAEQECLTAARTFAADAAPLKDEFVRRGLNADFIEDLDAGVGELQESIGVKAEKTGARVAATVAVSKSSEHGREAVRELDAVVRNVFRDDPSALAEWESASHVERAARHADNRAPHTQTPPAKE